MHPVKKRDKNVEMHWQMASFVLAKFLMRLPQQLLLFNLKPFSQSELFKRGIDTTFTPSCLHPSGYSTSCDF